MTVYNRMHIPGSAMSLGECQAALAAAQRETDELREKYLRTAAALENKRKQTERDIAARVAERMRGFGARMIEVADNLERALSHAASDDPLLPGVRATLQQLQSALRQEGVEPIVVHEGAPFDPRLHEAIAGFASDVTQDTVAEITQSGYTLDGQLLRPARVVVAYPSHSEHGMNGG
jgi:molecular chaperone GrpE